MEKLSAQGLILDAALLDSVKEFDCVKETYLLEPGQYNVDFGFREFGQHEYDWSAGSSDDLSTREGAFLLDYDHPDVVNFAAELLSPSQNLEDPQSFRLLTNRYHAAIRSMSLSETERNTSLSDIVRNKAGMCDSKTTLLGTLLVKQGITTQAIGGQYGRVREKVSYPFGHQWMRISIENKTYLYDAMYDNFAAFELDGSGVRALDDGVKIFSNMTPDAYPAAVLINKLKLKRWAGVKLVKSYESNKVWDVFVEDDNILASQLFNNIQFAFEVEEAIQITLHDKSIRTGPPTSGIYYPVIQLRRI